MSSRSTDGQVGCSVALIAMKARQAAKLREIRDCLIADGCTHLDSQAVALGVSRSTAWTIINGTHKASGLSAHIIARMLSCPRLPPHAREKILEYVREKSEGRYGGSKSRRRTFMNACADQAPLGLG